jgi:hypothetical protein
MDVNRMGLDAVMRSAPGFDAARKESPRAEGTTRMSGPEDRLAYRPHSIKPIRGHPTSASDVASLSSSEP